MCYYSDYEVCEDQVEISLKEEYGQYLDEVCLCHQSDDCICMSFEKFKNKKIDDMIDHMSEEYAI
jgi:hypothetical protein